MRSGLALSIVAISLSAASFTTAAEAPSVEVIGHPTGPACTSLADLSFQWYAAAYFSPDKPMQLIVQGQSGHVTNGPAYRSMVEEIRKQAEACGEELSNGKR